MPGIFFTNAWMLAGLAALAVPILIHLLLRQKRRRIRFSTVQFFARQDEQSAQRRKLRNWLLLALRLLICALLVFAFARPYLQNDAGAGQRQQHVIILLDRSLSMQAQAAGTPRWGRAQEAVRRVLAELQADDRAALVSCGEQAEVLCEWAPAAKVSQVLEEVQPAFGAADLGAGFRQARVLLAAIDPGAAARIAVVSDLQRNSLLNLAAYPLPEQTEVQVISVGDLTTPNLAITDLNLDARPGEAPEAVVTSFSDEDCPEITLELKVDDKPAGAQTFALAAGASTNLQLTLPLLKPGWHHLAVEIQSRDALTMDNARYETIFVPEPVRALVVETGPAQRPYERETFYVTTALNPGKDSTNAVRSPFEFETIAPEALAGKLALVSGRLPCDVLVLPALRQVPSGLGRAVQSYAGAGGGVLLFLGEGVSANRYNIDFGEWLPARLGAMETRAELVAPWRIGPHDTNSPMFAAFQLPNSGEVSLARFTGRFALTPRDPGGVVARFDDGVPLIATATIGAGRVVLVNTSADSTWTDWPKRKTFVPWLHGAAKMLAAVVQTNPPPAPALLAGAGVDIPVHSPAGTSFRVECLNGNRPIELNADADGRLRDVTLPGPGVYSLRDPSGVEKLRLAVNVPAPESDLTAVAPGDFQQQIARIKESPPTTLAAGLFGTGNNNTELARALLAAVLGLLMIELLVANRTLA